MLAAQRIILQSPDWLAFYARFGWRSWTRISDGAWDFIPRYKLISVREVPMIGYHPIKSKLYQGAQHPEAGQVFPDRQTLYVTLDGKIVPYPSKQGRSPYQYLYKPLPAALDQIRALVAQHGPRIKQNLQWSTGRYYVRFGRPPPSERSQIFLPGHRERPPEYEQGVSVYDCYFDIQEERWALEEPEDGRSVAGTMQSLIYSKKRVYLVQGDLLDELGTDGEPLLRNVKIVKELDKRDVYMPGVFDPREDMDEFNEGFNYVKPVPVLISEDDEEDRTPAMAEFYHWFRRSKEQKYIRVHLTQDDSNSPLSVNSIRSTRMSSGAATAVMNKISQIADKYGLPVTLVVDETSESANWLEGWYRRLGYRPTGETGDHGPVMIRQPMRKAA